MRRVWVVFCVLYFAAAVKEPALVRRAIAEPARYTIHTTLLLNAAERRDRDVGYRIKSELHVAKLPDETDVLLRFQLVGSELQVRGVHRSAEWEPRASLWDSEGGAPWLARLDPAGAVKAVLLPKADTADVRNYKRAITSLFQFEAETALDAGHVERTESDISGTCDVIYEKVANGARKIKRGCSHDESAGVNARRIIRYTLAPTKTLADLHAEEVVILEQVVKVRSWHALSYIDNKPNSKPLELDQLETTDLALEGSPSEIEDKTLDLSEVIEQYASALGDEDAGAGGDISAASALLNLLPALTKAEQPALDRTLTAASENSAKLNGLCRALGLAGTLNTARAASAFIRLDAKEPLTNLAYHYLVGLSLSHAPQLEAVQYILKIAEKAKNEDVQNAAFLAVASASKALELSAVKEAIVKGLKRCKTDSCRASRLLALGNLRASASDILLSSAEKESPEVAAAALSALRYSTDIESKHLRRVGRFALNVSLPIEVRAAALDLVVQKRAASENPGAPLQVLELALALHSERGNTAHELRRVLWQRLSLLEQAPPVRALMPLLPTTLRTWHARAHAGTSHVLTRALNWAGSAGKWLAALDSVQVARNGVLRRGIVSLLASTPSGVQHSELEVEVWTRGLHSLAGGEGEGEDEGEGMAGGLALTVGGARLTDVKLFDGQAELLGHVWSGTGSTPTAVVRGARIARYSDGALPLAAGTWTTTKVRAAVALALDAHATVSLWQRAARAGMLLRGCVTARAAHTVHVPWARLQASKELTAEPRLRIALDLDFYSGVNLCVRAAEPAHTVREEFKLAGLVGARHLNVTRGATSARHVAGRTLSLGRDNDVSCRTLRAADEDDE